MELNDEQLLASAAKFLIDGGEEDAASVLLACSMSAWESGDTWWVGDETHYAVHVALTGPRAAYEAIEGSNSTVQKAIGRAVQAVLPPGHYVKHLTGHVEAANIDEDWRTELLEIARGRGVHNQAGVLFLPNCMARVGIPSAR